jgi:hypothetical protein
MDVEGRSYTLIGAQNRGVTSRMFDFISLNRDIATKGDLAFAEVGWADQIQRTLSGATAGH